MHPAYSVIFFTTASGAGYGLLALLGVLVPLGLIPASPLFGAVSGGLALILISAGLLSSSAHLGRPERAWRAFSQWRSSWLSREGIAAVATYLPALAFGCGWVMLGRLDGWVAIAGLLAAAGAASTVSATAMIYASLKPVGAWHNGWTLPSYLVFATMTGATLLHALATIFGPAPQWLGPAAMLATFAGWLVKVAAWRHVDRKPQVSTANSATGLAGGTVRSIEWPHTEENYLLKEMGYRIARKHARRLRLIAQWSAFLLPISLILISRFTSANVGAVLSVAAAVVQLSGMLVERWLFFAEARHTIVLYYGR